MIHQLHNALSRNLAFPHHRVIPNKMYGASVGYQELLRIVSSKGCGLRQPMFNKQPSRPCIAENNVFIEVNELALAKHHVHDRLCRHKPVGIVGYHTTRMEELPTP